MRNKASVVIFKLAFVLAAILLVKTAGAQCTLQISRSPEGSICDGQTVTFSATGASGYTWSATQNGNPVEFLNGEPVIENINPGEWVVSVHSPGCTSAHVGPFTVKGPVDGTLQISGPSTLCQDAANSGFSVNASLISNEDEIGNWQISPSSAGSISGSGATASVDWSPTFHGSAVISAVAYGCNESSVYGSKTVNVTQARQTTLSGNNVICTNQEYVLTVNNPDLSTSVVYSIFMNGTLFHEFEHPLVNYSVTATANGVYTIQVNQTSCPSDQVGGTVTINRSAGSTLSISSGGDEFCEGDEISFSATGGSNYSWYMVTEEGSQNVPNGTPDLNGIPGEYTIELRGSNSCGVQQTVTTPITIIDDVNGNPIMAGHSETCDPTSTVTAFADAPAAISWSVTPSGAATGVTTTILSDSSSRAVITWTPSFSGTATVEAVATGCSNVTSSTKGILLKKPTALSITPSPSAVICQGSTVTLTPGGGVAVSYRWNGPNGFQSQSSPLTIRIDSTTTFRLFGLESTCLMGRTKTIEVIVAAQSDGGVALSTTSAKAYNKVASSTYETATLHNFVGQVERWEYRANAGPWTAIPNSASATSPQTSYLPSYGSTVAFKAMVKNGTCPVRASDEVWYGWGVEPDRNFVRLITPQRPFSTGTQVFTNYGNADSVSVVTDYFDGSTRSVQTVSHFQSPSKKDLVVHKEYDSAGREAKAYLPFSSADVLGYFKDDARVLQSSFYASPPAAVVSDITPFAKTVFEPSPLNRLLKQGAPGEDWQPGAHPITKEYQFNLTDEILDFDYDISTKQLSLNPNAAFYKENKLLRNKTIDEDQNDIFEFVDNQGRTICKKVRASVDTYAATYYVYDDMGNLVVVIPPEGVMRVFEILNQQP